MSDTSITLSEALRQYMSVAGKTVEEINFIVFEAPFPKDPFKGGVNYLNLVAAGKQGNDPLTGDQYTDGSKMLATFLIDERARLTPASHAGAAHAPAPAREPADDRSAKRKRRPRKPAAKQG